MVEPTIEELSHAFNRFSEIECRESSPLYEKLSLSISKDKDLLQIASHSTHGPVPNIFFAAVRYLLLKGNGPELSEFYPDIGLSSGVEGDPFPLFHSFCVENESSIDAILSCRFVQTNEVQRSSLLMPAFQFVLSKTDKPLAHIEIGASAGLNLLWDGYAYDYGSGVIYDKKDSEVRLECDLKGTLFPPLRSELPGVVYRSGIDLNPLSVVNDDDVLWLKALVWPEHRKRLQLLDSAINIARGHSPEIVKGDALEILPELMEEAPLNSSICITSTFMLNQFRKEKREELKDLISHEALSRSIYFIYVEYVGYSQGSYPELHAIRYENAERQDEKLALCQPHGYWLEWVYPS